MATGNMKTIKRRIKSVGSTMKITKAMELVASSKMRRAKQKLLEARPYFEEQFRMMCEIERSYPIESEFYAKRDVKRRLQIVIAGDRGLAGGYNSNMFKLVIADHKEKGDADKSTTEKPKIIAVGKKSIEFFGKRGFELVMKRSGLEDIQSGHCSAIANAVVNLFLKGEVDEVDLFYTKFVSTMVQEAVCIPLLPLQHGLIGEQMLKKNDNTDTAPDKKGMEIHFDPTPQSVFNRIVPSFLMSVIQCAVTDSYTSEQCARRLAMESASDNAEEMIENLSLLYNRARQEKITNEINEIVGGANAL